MRLHESPNRCPPLSYRAALHHSSCSSKPSSQVSHRAGHRAARSRDRRRSPTTRAGCRRTASLSRSRARRIDGHQFVDQAMERGAVALVVAKPEMHGARPTLVVEDSRRALADLAHLLRKSGAASEDGRRHRHEWQDDHGLSAQAHLRASAGLRCGLIGTVRYEIGDRSSARRAHHAGVARCAGAALADASRRLQGRGHGGLLPRARAGARARPGIGRRDLHQSDAGPSRLSPDDGDLLRGQGAPVHRPDRARPTRRATPSSISTIATARSWSNRLGDRLPGHHLRAGRSARISARAITARISTARRISSMRTEAAISCGCRSSGTSTFTTRSPRSPPRRRWASTCARPCSPREGAAGARPSRSGSGEAAVPDLRRLRAHRRRAAQRPEDPARAEARAADRRLRLRRRSRSGEASADGPGRGSKRRLQHRHLRQSAQGRSARDHRRDQAGLSVRATTKRSSIAREAITRAIALAQPRDIVLIAGKGHETYQEFADHTIPFDDVQIAQRALRKPPAGILN